MCSNILHSRILLASTLKMQVNKAYMYMFLGHTRKQYLFDILSDIAIFISLSKTVATYPTDEVKVKLLGLEKELK